MKTKLCGKCGETRESEFYPSRPSTCKRCLVEYQMAWREENYDVYLVRQRNWMRRHPKPPGHDVWRANHLEEARLRASLYKQEHRLEANAQSQAQYHYPMAQTCSVEDCNNNGERHHPDYNKPKEVVWLCRAHHAKLRMICERS